MRRTFFLRQGGASAAHAIGVSIAVIMAWGLWKFLASALLYIHLLTRFNLPQAPLVRQATPTELVDRPERRFRSIAQALLKFDDWCHRSFSSGTTRVVLITIASAILISLWQSGKASA